MPHKVAIYLRVSTNDQEKGIASQEAAIKRYLKGNGIKKATWYRDRISGTTTRRPGLDRLNKAIFNGEVNQVVVWALDRLTRKGAAEGLTMLAKWFDRQVRVVSVSEQFDLYGKEGELLASVLFAIAKMQRTALVEATKRGLEEAKERGVKLGKRAGPWVKKIAPLYEQGLNVSQIAKRLKRSRQAVYNAIDRDNIKLYRPAS